MVFPSGSEIRVQTRVWVICWYEQFELDIRGGARFQSDGGNAETEDLVCDGNVR